MDTSKSIFNSLLTNKCWDDLLSLYDKAVEVVAKKKSKLNLIELDHFLMLEYPQLVFSRESQHLTLVELSKIMTWKITRGKFRPLQKLVDSNPANVVESVSQEAFECMNKMIKESLSKTSNSDSSRAIKATDDDIMDWKRVMEIMTKLKGIGPATASAILAPLYPQYFPFMSDEAMIASFDNDNHNSKIEYTIKSYASFRQRMMNKAKALGGHWTAEEVGKAIWTYEILSSNGVNPFQHHSTSNLETSSSSSSSSGSSSNADDDLQVKKHKTDRGSDGLIDGVVESKKQPLGPSSSTTDASVVTDSKKESVDSSNNKKRRTT